MSDTLVLDRIESNLTRLRLPKIREILKHVLQIAETQAKDISMGLSVSVDTRNGIVNGKVLRIDPRVVNGTVQVDVIFSEKLPNGARPDLHVDGTITLERLSDVLYVSRPSYAEAATESTVFKINNSADGAYRTAVVYGRSSVNYIEILKGLDEGEEIILSDMSNWSDEERLSFE